MKYLVIIVVLFGSCFSTNKISKVSNKKNNLETAELANYETAYFASGCFWCVEAIYESVKGVKEVKSGYSGGHLKNPTYQLIGTGKTGHAEAVEVFYDPKIVSFETLTYIFFGSGDPTTLNRQGNDSGTQYRSIVFYKNLQEKQTIEKIKKELELKKVFKNPIVTEITMFEKFWIAEDYHQDYEKLNPNNSYVKAVSIPRLNRFKAAFAKFLK